jgi:hypothetical protein
MVENDRSMVVEFTEVMNYYTDQEGQRKQQNSRRDDGECIVDLG